jgi:hypothetical protein
MSDQTVTPDELRALAAIEANRRDDLADPYWTAKAITTFHAAADALEAAQTKLAQVRAGIEDKVAYLNGETSLMPGPRHHDDITAAAWLNWVLETFLGENGGDGA